MVDLLFNLWQDKLFITNLGAISTITEYVNDKFIKFHQPVL